MRRVRAILIAGAGLGMLGAAPAPKLLLPVTDADTMNVGGMGCESWFTQGETGYTFMRNTTLVLRTAPGKAGLHVCELPQAEADGFGDGPKTVTCGGRKVTVRPTGRASGHPEADSVDYPATLTIQDKTRRAVLRGRYGTAC